MSIYTGNDPGCRRTFLAGYPVRAAFLQPKELDSALGPRRLENACFLQDDNLIQEEKTKIAPAGTKAGCLLSSGGNRSQPPEACGGMYVTGSDVDHFPMGCSFCIWNCSVLRDTGTPCDMQLAPGVCDI